MISHITGHRHFQVLTSVHRILMSRSLVPVLFIHDNMIINSFQRTKIRKLFQNLGLSSGVIFAVVDELLLCLPMEWRQD